jgi:hypothetical protein
MKIAVLGTGMVGRTMAARLAALGHQVTVGTRDPDATAARATGSGSYRDWAEGAGVRTATFADAAAAAEIALNATSGASSLGVLAQAGAENLAGKILIDIANPLDFPDGELPTLRYCNTDSLGERIQRAFPETLVVKTLNTLTADLMARPGTLPEPGTVFLSGDDAGAKTTVTGLLHELGHTDVIDLGDITTARGAEMLLPVWLRIMGALGTAAFNFKIVR